MYCQKCGVENPEEAKFCKDCGSPFIDIKLYNSLVENEPAIHISDKSLDSYLQEGIRLILRPIIRQGMSSKSSYNLFIDRNIIKKGLLRDGFDFHYLPKANGSSYLVEIKFDLYAIILNIKTEEIRDFSERLHFDLKQNKSIEFIYKETTFW